MDDLLTRYLSGKSENSRKVYKSEITRFLSFMEARGPVDAVSSADLDAYHRERTAKGAKAGTLKRAFSMIRGFLALVEEHSGDFRNPIGERGALVRYSAPSYAETDRFRSALNAYEKWLSAGNTRRAYSGAVARFFRSVGKAPEEITHDDLMTWRREQEIGRMKPATLGLYLSALSRFGRFLRYQGKPSMPADLLTREALGIPKRIRRKGRPDALTDAERKRFFDELGKAAKSSTIAARDHALFGFIYDYALRAGEAATGPGIDPARVGHFDPEKRKLELEGRKHQRGMASILELKIADAKNLEPLRRWLRREPAPRDSDPLICRVRWDRRDNVFYILRDRGLSVRSVEYRFRVWIRAAGIDTRNRRLVPHSLRHTRASELVRRWDLVKVRDFLGHGNIAQTDNYLHS